MKRKYQMASALVLSSVVLVAGCSNKSDDKKNESGGKNALAAKQVINLSETQDIPSMDTVLSKDAVSSMVLNNTMEGLYRMDKDNKPTPGVAESYEMSKDGKTYTFKLRKDAKWSNGDPVTAKDFVYAWQRTVDPATGAEYAFIMNDLKNAEKIQKKEAKPSELGVTAKDDHTLVVELERPVSYFLNLTAFTNFFPQNQKYVESQGKKFALEANTTIYNGPFEMKEWKHEQGWQLKKNDKYWDKKSVKLDEINFNVVKDVGTGVNLYESGQQDRVRLTAEFVDKYKGNKDLQVLKEASVYYLKMNEKNPAFQNVKIRKAFQSAIDTNALATVLLNNGSTAANYLVPKNFSFNPDTKKDFREENGDLTKFDAKEATKLWQEGLKEIGKDKVTLEFLNYDNESAKKTGEYIKGELEKNLPGLTVKIKMQPFAQKLELESKQDYDFTYAGWKPDYSDPITFLEMFTTDNSQNQMSYSNKEFDKLVNGAKEEADAGKRFDMLKQAETILLSDGAIAPLYQRGTSMLLRDTIKDVVYHQTGGEFSFKWAYVTK